MATPTHHMAMNVRWSAFRHFRVNFADVYPEYPVSYDDAFWDSDRRDETRLVRDRWVSLQELSNTAGQRGFLLLQIKCSGRVGTIARRVTDRHGRLLALMVQRARDAMLTKHIDMYDFTGGPPTPVRIQGRCCFVLNSRGKHRVPEADQEVPRTAAGVREHVLTYRIQTPHDGAGGQTYDVGA